MDETERADSGDSVLRAMTDDGAFRVITAKTTATVAAAIAAQHARGRTATRLAELVTGAILVRETMAPTLRVQAILRGAGGTGNLVADSHPDGWARGLVQASGKNAMVAFGQGSLLQVMRTLPNGELQRGVVEVPDPGGIAEALMNYMQQSEQVISVIAVGCVLDGNEVKTAGGYVVQLLPEVGEGPLMVMTERMSEFVDAGPLLERYDASPEAILDEILYGMPYTRLEHSPLRFGCNCSAVRVLASLGTLPRKDIEDLASAGAPLDMSCEYCGSSYHVPLEKLRGLLAAS